MRLRWLVGRKKLASIKCKFTVSEFIATTSPGFAPASRLKPAAARS
jgi:hypothetical protein